jgi:hypothetical protein
VTTFGDTQAIARVTDVGPNTVVAPAVSNAHPLLAPVPMLPVPAPATAMIPAHLAGPALAVTEELPQAFAPVVEERAALLGEAADDEPADATMDDDIDEDLAGSADEVDDRAEDDTAEDDRAEDDDHDLVDDADQAPEADPVLPSHELIYEEAMASIAELARNWSDAVEGLYVSTTHRAAA